MEQIAAAAGGELRVAVGAADDAHDDRAFVELLGSELPRIQRLARLLTGDPHAADDLVADAIAATLPRWREGGVDDPAAYLRRVLVNRASGRWKRLAMGRARDRASFEWITPVTATDDAVVERDRTLRALARLPARRRAVVVLRFYDDLPLERIAELLDVKEGTVKSTLARGLEQLRRELGGLS